APGDVAAPAGELIGGEAAGLLRLVQQGGGAIDVAVGERLGHFGRKQPLLEACDARVAGGGRLEIRECEHGLIHTAAAQCLLEACGKDPRHALQPVLRLAVDGVRSRGRAVIQQRVVGGRRRKAALMRSRTAGGVAPDVGGACSAAAMASANTAWVLRGSIEVGSTANTRLSLRAAPSSFSAGPSANTSTTARGTCACAAS